MIWTSNRYKTNMSQTSHSPLLNLLHLQLFPSQLMVSSFFWLIPHLKKKKSWSHSWFPFLSSSTYTRVRKACWLFLQNIQDPDASHHFQCYHPSLNHHFHSCGLLWFPSIHLISTFVSSTFQPLFLLYSVPNKAIFFLRLKCKWYYFFIFETFQELLTQSESPCPHKVLHHTACPHLPDLISCYTAPPSPATLASLLLLTQRRQVCHQITTWLTFIKPLILFPFPLYNYPH